MGDDLSAQERKLLLSLRGGLLLRDASQVRALEQPRSIAFWRETTEAMLAWDHWSISVEEAIVYIQTVRTNPQWEAVASATLLKYLLDSGRERSFELLDEAWRRTMAAGPGVIVLLEDLAGGAVERHRALRGGRAPGAAAEHWQGLASVLAAIEAALLPAAAQERP